MASERLQVVLQLVAGQYKSEARQAASATSEVARQAQSAGGSIGQLDASLRVVAQKMGITEAEARDLATQMSRGVKESNQLYGELVALGKQMGLSDREARQFARSIQKAGTETDQAADKVDKAASRFDGFASRIGSTLAGLGIGFGIHEIGQFIGQAITDAAELEQSIGGVEAVFGDLAGTILDASKVAAENVGLSERAYQQLAARLGGQLQTFGFSADEAVQKTQDLIVVGADLAATYGGTVAEAIEAISALLRGESNPIERYAIAINQTAINARAMELGLAASTTQVDFHAKAVAALDLLYEQAARSQGQFAREAGTASGQQERLRAEFENMRAEIGMELLPIFTELMETGRDLIPVFKEMASEAAGFAAELGNAVGFVKDLQGLGIDIPIVDQAGPRQLNEIARAAAKADSEANFFERTLARVFNALSRVDPTMRMHLDSLEKQADAYERSRLVTDAASAAWEHHTTEIQAGITGYDRLVPMVEDADRAMLNMAQRGDAADVLARMKTEAESAVPNLQDFAEAVRDIRNALLEATDPAFAAISAQLRADEAIAKADEAKKAWEKGEGTAEDYYQAVSDAAEAVLAADAANADLGANAPRHLRTVQSAFDEVTEAIDEPRIQVRELLEDLQIIDSMGTIQFRIDLDMDPADRVLIEGVASGRLRGPQPAPRPRTPGTPDNRSIAVRQHGGPVSPGQLVRVGEGNQPELYLIPGERGHVFSQSQAMRLMQGMGGGDNVTINLYGSGIAEPDIGLLVAMAGVRRRVETRRRL